MINTRKHEVDNSFANYGEDLPNPNQVGYIEWIKKIKNDTTNG